MRGRSRGIAWTGAPVLVALGLLVSLTGCGTSDTSEPVQEGDTQWVTYTEPRRVTASDPSERAASAAAASMVESHDEDFLGSYVDTSGQVVLVASTDAGESMARRELDLVEDVRVERAPLSLRQAAAFGEDLRALAPGLGEAVLQWGADPRSGGVFVTTRRRLSDEERRAVNELAASRRVPVRVELEVGVSDGTLD